MLTFLRVFYREAVTRQAAWFRSSEGWFSLAGGLPVCDVIVPGPVLVVMALFMTFSTQTCSACSECDFMTASF
jgi:hypothetical protein